MPVVVQSPEARQDLLEIWLYVARDNPEAANRLVDRFDEKLKLLSETPEIGQRREELAPSLRSLPVGNYLLFYRPTSGGIELVRVLHGARSLRRLFRR